MQKRERAMLGTERELRATNIELAAAKTELKRCRRFQSDAEGRCADLVSQLEHWHSEATDARRLASEEVLNCKELQEKLSQHVARDLQHAKEDTERDKLMDEMRTELGALKENWVPKRQP